MLFNTLGVAACASLFIKKPIQIDWWPITRDSTLFIFNLMLLVTFAWDGKAGSSFAPHRYSFFAHSGAIMWWEASILVTLLVLYWVFMFQNKRIVKGVKYVIEERLLWCQRIKNYDIANQRPKTQPEIDEKPEVKEPEPIEKAEHPNYRRYTDAEAPDFGKLRERRQSTNLTEIYAIEAEEEEEFKLYELPQNVSRLQMFWYFFTWPIRFLLHYTIPHPFRFKKLFVISFLMCIVWIACMSYIVFWMVVIVGDTFRIPDPVMGLTFLAFGGCMPEAISAVIVARKGSGQMGVSNALGANCLAILFSLGMPWFIRTMADGAGWTGAHIKIYSYGVEFTLIAIIFAVIMLYIVIAAVGYKLRKTVGAILFLGYLLFATFAILVEIDVLFERECKWKE
jgi:sodium/potassium/calcium exchanger 4